MTVPAELLPGNIIILNGHNANHPVIDTLRLYPVMAGHARDESIIQGKALGTDKFISIPLVDIREVVHALGIRAFFGVTEAARLVDGLLQEKNITFRGILCMATIPRAGASGMRVVGSRKTQYT